MMVSRKLFFAIAALVIMLGLFFIFIMQFALRDSLYSMMEAARGDEVQILNEQFAEFYESNGRSWKDVQRFIAEEIDLEPHAGLVLLARDQTFLGHKGTMDERVIVHDGLRSVIRSNRDHYAAVLFLYDDDIAEMSKWRNSSFYMTLFFTVAGVIILVAIFLALAYWLSKRLTAPLSLMLPVIERLKHGELGVQAPVLSQDEYGKVAGAFNEMSRELLRAEHVRRSLVADVAHELRTPLTIMRGKLELFQQNKMPIKPAALLPIQDELLRLTVLVEEIHQISLAEAGKLPMKIEALDLNKWVRKSVEHIREEADLRKIDLIVETADEPIVAHVDPSRMSQVLTNLLSNAFRHTPEKGSVTVRLSQAGTEDIVPHAIISVTDTGEGIEAKHLPYVFDRFYRADEDRSREGGGMGLGLAISKQLMEAHGGSIEVQSTVAVGTTFTLRLPLRL